MTELSTRHLGQDPRLREGFFLNGWRVEPKRNRIDSGDAERRLDPRVMEVLLHLAARPGEVVTRRELSESIWRDTYIGENTVSQAVSRLRKALGDDRREPKYVETISKSGYRLIADVRLEDRATAATIEEKAAAADARDERRWTNPNGLSAILAALVTFALVTMWPKPASPPIGPLLPQITPELTLEGNQFEPVLSPDGERVAFCWRSDETLPWSIWIHEVGGDSPRRLTDLVDHERLPAWSPDGESIAFARFTIEGEPVGIYRCGIADGGLTRLAELSRPIRSMVWSPDGATLAMEAGDSTRNQTRIELLDLETQQVHPLTAPPAETLGDRTPAFSPDGGSVAFARRVSRTRHDIMLVSTDGGEPKRLTDDAWGQTRGLDWRTNGQHVLYSSNRNGQYALWEISPLGGTPRMVPIHDTWVTQPSVARSGGRLTYRTFRDVVDVWSVPLDESGVVTGEPAKAVPSTRSEREPASSPGGRVAFISDRSGTWELWSAKPDGSRPMRHTDFRGAIPAAPSWSPDEERIVFHASIDGQSDVWSVASDERSPTRVTRELSEERNATFSRDGRWIYFASDRSGEWQVWRMVATGGAAELVVGGGAFLAHESIDGETLFVAKLDEPGIWRMDSSGGELELVLDTLDLADGAGWIVGESRLYYVSRGPTSIRAVDLADGSTHTVFTPARQIPYLGRSLALSADGRTLLFSMIERSDDEVMRVDLAGL